jgi:hypothetical protein
MACISHVPVWGVHECRPLQASGLGYVDNVLVVAAW